jgi:Flp pilus assembly protein TadD
LAEAHVSLGNALAAKGLLDEAVSSYHKAIDLDPQDAKAHNNLATALSRQGRKEDAMASYRKAIEIDPGYSNAYYNLAAMLEGKGLLDDAILAYRKVIEISPRDAEAHIGLGNVLKSKGLFDQAIAAYRKAIELAPKDARAPYALGNTLAAQGRPKEAEAEFREALRIKEDYPEAHCNLGHTLRGQGRFEESLVSFKRGHELGSKQPGWRYPSAKWVLEAERLVALDRKLAGVLKGQDQPTDAAERLAFAQLCFQYKKLPHTAARFCADAFAAEPKLATDTRSGNRYNAARAASLAAAGQGEDAVKLADEERARLRQQALDWLRADLTAWTKVMDQGPPQARQVVAQMLQHWQKEADLANLRGKAALDQLPAAERDGWQRLWADVAALLQRAQEK